MRWMVAGGAESPISEIGSPGSNACKALSTKRADDRPRPAAPMTPTATGFVMGEGAGVVVLEEYEHAKARGAKIYAEGWAMGCRAMLSHYRAHEDGDGGYRSSGSAEAGRADAGGISDYINAHGTSTMAAP